MSSEQMPQDRWCASRGEYISVPPHEELVRRQREEEEWWEHNRRKEAERLEAWRAAEKTYPEFCCRWPVAEMDRQNGDPVCPMCGSRVLKTVVSER